MLLWVNSEKNKQLLYLRWLRLLIVGFNNRDRHNPGVDVVNDYVPCERLNLGTGCFVVWAAIVHRGLEIGKRASRIA